jgi:hypothetical protein
MNQMSVNDAKRVFRILSLLERINDKYGKPHGTNPIGITLAAYRALKENNVSYKTVKETNNIRDYQGLVNNYIQWFRQKITVESSIDGVCEIVVPSLNRINDNLKIYLKRSNGGFILTDDSRTISNFVFSSAKSKQHLILPRILFILDVFGVRLVENELVVEARTDNFPEKLHNFIQAITAVNDIISFSGINQKSSFPVARQ